jgi:hypothetical protein
MMRPKLLKRDSANGELVGQFHKPGRLMIAVAAPVLVGHLSFARTDTPRLLFFRLGWRRRELHPE